MCLNYFLISTPTTMSEVLVSSLYDKYVQERAVPLNEEQFISFLAFFPVLLVAASDGIVDWEEWRYCQKLAHGLVASFQEDDLSEDAQSLTRIYRREFIYLLSNLEEWEEEFLQALEVYFQEFPYAKKFVTQTLYLFADASDGVCEQEEDTMEYLCLRLKLDHKDFQPFDELRE